MMQIGSEIWTNYNQIKYKRTQFKWRINYWGGGSFYLWPEWNKKEQIYPPVINKETKIQQTKCMEQWFSRHLDIKQWGTVITQIWKINTHSLCLSRKRVQRRSCERERISHPQGGPWGFSRILINTYFVFEETIKAKKEPSERISRKNTWNTYRTRNLMCFQ